AGRAVRAGAVAPLDPGGAARAGAGAAAVPPHAGPHPAVGRGLDRAAQHRLRTRSAGPGLVTDRGGVAVPPPAWPQAPSALLSRRGADPFPHVVRRAGSVTGPAGDPSWAPRAIRPGLSFLFPGAPP